MMMEWNQELDEKYFNSRLVKSNRLVKSKKGKVDLAYETSR